jgi:hypothetical protein
LPGSPRKKCVLPWTKCRLCDSSLLCSNEPMLCLQKLPLHSVPSPTPSSPVSHIHFGPTRAIVGGSSFALDPMWSQTFLSYCHFASPRITKTNFLPLTFHYSEQLSLLLCCLAPGKHCSASWLTGDRRTLQMPCKAESGV